MNDMTQRKFSPQRETSWRAFPGVALTLAYKQRRQSQSFGFTQRLHSPCAQCLSKPMP